MASYVSRQLVGSLARSAAVALHRAGGSSQRPTAWATPVVVSSSVAPKACRVHGMAGVDEVGSRRTAQAGDAGVVRHACARLGTECGTRAAEQRVAVVSTSDPMQEAWSGRSCGVRTCAGWCQRDGSRAPARRRDQRKAPVPCLQRGPFERRRDDDPGTLVLDARELALGEDDGRHPLVTAYSPNT